MADILGFMWQIGVLNTVYYLPLVFFFVVVAALAVVIRMGKVRPAFPLLSFLTYRQPFIVYEITGIGYRTYQDRGRLFFDPSSRTWKYDLLKTNLLMPMPQPEYITNVMSVMKVGLELYPVKFVPDKNEGELRGMLDESAIVELFKKADEVVLKTQPDRTMLEKLAPYLLLLGIGFLLLIGLYITLQSLNTVAAILSDGLSKAQICVKPPPA